MIDSEAALMENISVEAAFCLYGGKKMGVKNKVRRILAQQMCISERAVDDIKKKHRPEDYGMDSLDQIELIMAVEEEFDIEISDEEAITLVTLGDLIEMVKGKVVDTEEFGTTWRTIGEWNKKGKYVKNGEKCVLRDKRGICLFSAKQVKKIEHKEFEVSGQPMQPTYNNDFRCKPDYDYDNYDLE